MANVKYVKSLSVAIDAENIATLDIGKTNANLKKLTDVLGENAENAALRNAENTFTEKQTINNSLEIKPSNVATVANITSTIAGSNVANPVSGDNLVAVALVSEDDPNKNFGSLGISANNNNRTSYLNVKDTSGTIIAGIKAVYDTDTQKAKVHITSNTDINTAEDSEALTVGLLKQSLNNPNIFPHASEEKAGIIELATQEEVNTGTDTERAITPKTLKTITDDLNEKIKSVNKGQSQLAYKDYTQVGNQGEMVIGTYYKVPFNSEDKFILFDKNTGKPATTQDPNVGENRKVAKYVIMFKGDDGNVSNLGEEDPRIDFEDMASKSKDNTFTGSNTFNKSITAVGGITSDHSVDVATDNNQIPNSSQVKTYVDSKAPKVVSALPEAQSMEEGIIYLVVDEE